MNQVVDPGARDLAAAAAENSQRFRPKVWLALILAAYLVITLAYGALNPLFESPDEHMHYLTVQYLADYGRLPSVAPGNAYDAWIGQEAAQPPLYYLIGAGLIAPLNPVNPSSELWLNEFTAMGDASSLNNINRFVHDGRDAFPWHGYAFAGHLLRGLSTLFGLGTLLFIYGSGRRLWPADPYRALLAASLVAFLPQFNFLHASITNDTLIIFLISAALWQIIRLWLDHVSIVRLLLLGVTIGFASLTKNAGIVLLVYAVGVLVLLAIRSQTKLDDAPPDDLIEPVSPSLAGIRLLLVVFVFMIVPAILISGWLWARNWQLYGDFTATNQFVRIAGGDRDYTVWQVFGESGGLWLSLFAVFGWFNLRPPDWVYWFWNGVIALAAAGALWHGLRRFRFRQRPSAARSSGRSFTAHMVHLLRQKWVLPALLAGWVLLVYASLVTFMLQTEAAQGRLLFPALVPLALGAAYGLTVESPIRRISRLLPPAALFVTLYCLFFVIYPAYARPGLVTTLPAEAASFDAHLGQGLTLIGAEIETQEAGAGDKIWMTLYWSARSKIEAAPEFAVTVFGRELTEVGKHHGYHGRGMYPASLWEPGEIVVDRFSVQLNEALAAPALAQIRVNVIDGESDLAVGEVKLIPEGWPSSKSPVLAQIGDAIALTSTEIHPSTVRAGDTIGLDVQWHVLQPPGVDLTTLVHIGQPDQAPLAVGDRPPLNGDYPTRVWEKGEVINDSYGLTLPADLPAGKYPLWVGLYDSETITRWLLASGGSPQPNNVYLAGWVEVVE